MSKSKTFLASALMAIALLLIVMASIAMAEAPNNVSSDATGLSTLQDDITYTVDYDPKAIYDFDNYTFTYEFALHNTSTETSPITPTLVVTLSEYLNFDQASGTVVLPDGDGETLLFPGGNVIQWSPVLTYCEWYTLTIEATADIDSGSLMLPSLMTEWQLDDAPAEEMETSLILPRIYLPLTLKNFS